MVRKNQARIRLRRRMAERDLRMKDLASAVQHDVSVVSKAVNHQRFPRVVRKIEEVLGV